MGSVTETSGAAMFSSCTEEEKVGQLGFIFSNQSLVLLWLQNDQDVHTKRRKWLKNKGIFG
jgi:hypothetical protein